jgi:hypothetical protein
MLYNIAFTAGAFAVSYFIGPYIINHYINISGLTQGARESIGYVLSIQIFQVIELIYFNHYEWEVMKGILQKYQLFHDNWDKKMDSFQKKWNEDNDHNKLQMSELLKSRSRTGTILDEFAKCNIIVDALHAKVRDDLELDKEITVSLQNDQKEFHDFIFSLKYDAFFNSHFQCRAKEKEVLKIPSYYFKNNIWREFVERAYCYYSIQLLVDKQAKGYLEDRPRMHGEINHLLSKSKGENRTEIKKLFIIEDECFDGNDKIVNGAIKDYLTEWNDSFKNIYDVLPVKVLKKCKAYGMVVSKGDELSDIGIFGNVYGEQSVVEKGQRNDELRFDDLQIDFYFDRSKTDRQKRIFMALINEAIMLSDVF